MTTIGLEILEMVLIYLMTKNRPGKDGNANADTGKKLSEYGG